MTVFSITRITSIIFLLFVQITLFASQKLVDATFSSETEFKVLNESESVYTEKGRYLILNKEGLKFCKQSFAYGFNSEIKRISAVVKSLDGKIIKKLKKSEIADRNAQSRGSLYIDTRIKSFELSATTFPFILEYTVVKEYTNAFAYPTWSPKIDYNLKNRKSEFKLVVPNAEMVNICEQNITPAQVIKTGKTIEYYWEVENIQPLADEMYSWPEYYDMAKVFLAPSLFYCKYNGNNNSWTDFGNWIYKLNENRDLITEQEKQTVDSILLASDSDFNKIDILYKYLQNNTRYVSIQEGIGGWQPYTAKYVCQNKYGDCKALTNYMHALLKYVGIKSNYVLVKAGNSINDINTQFPSSQFNHAILMVQTGFDTLWLDCTSKITPTGFVEKFIADRHALVIEKDSSHIVSIPTYNESQNVNSFKGTIHVKPDLKGSATVILNRIGHTSSRSRSLKKYYNAHLTEMYSDNKLNFPSYSIKSNDHFEEVLNYLPHVVDSLHVTISIAGKKAGDELFLSYALETGLKLPSIKNERKTDIWLSESFTRYDSLCYILPHGYSLSDSTSFEFKSNYGNVWCHIKPEGSKVYLLAGYSVKKGRYPKKDIEKFKKYINYINKIESYEIIVSKMP